MPVTRSLFMTAVLLGATATGVSARQAVTISTPTIDFRITGHGAGVPEPLIDGFKNPELIPDRVVLRSLYQSIAIPRHPTPEQEETFRTRIERLDLSEADFERMKDAMIRFHEQLTAQRKRLEEKRRLASSNPSAASISFQLNEHARIGALALTAHGDLLRSLSPDGRAKLRNFVTESKKRVKIYPSPDMASGFQFQDVAQ